MTIANAVTWSAWSVMILPTIAAIERASPPSLPRKGHCTHQKQTRKFDSMNNVQTAKKEGNCNICNAAEDNKINEDVGRIIGNLGISGKNIKYSLF